MKQIKFRAWNPKTQEMTSDFKSGDYSINTFFIDFPFPIMQFTGLKDKNGKEIFEGDLVTWTINNRVEKGIVTYVDEFGGYDLKNLMDEYYVCCDWLRGEYEIIGNIYETPITS